jgi:amino acid transporter
VIVVLIIAGLFTVVFAYATLNLFQMSMANIRFIREFGWTAVMEGALLQLLQIAISAALAMLSYIGFKICESELVHRYQNWQNR